jgi:hypothetical protein
MSKTLQLTETISNDIVSYLEEDIMDYLSPARYIPAAKKGLGALEKVGRKALGGKWYDVLGAEIDGWQKSHVLPSVAAMMSPQMHQAALEKGSLMGALQGGMGGAASDAGLGAFAGSHAAGPLIAKGGSAKSRAARTIFNLAKKFGLAALGSGAGTAIGGAAGTAAGALRGRAAGSAILGGGVPAGAVAMLAAALPGSIALGGLGLAAGAGALGGAVGSDIMKKAWQTRGQLAQGGATDTIFSSSPVARRVGGS